MTTNVLDFAAWSKQLRAETQPVPDWSQCVASEVEERDYAALALFTAERALEAHTVAAYESAADEIEDICDTFCNCPELWELAGVMRERGERLDRQVRGRLAARQAKRSEHLLASLRASVEQECWQ